MRPLPIVCLLSALLLGPVVSTTPAHSQPAPSPEAAASDTVEPGTLDGTWRGEIEIPGQSVEVRVHLRPGADGWTGTIDIPMQGVQGLPLQEIEISKESAKFRIAGIPGEPTFEGRRTADGIEGQFRQGGGLFPFRLARKLAREEPPNRPQTPRPPFPYASEDVRYGHGEVELAGTLTLPAGKGPFPAAVLATGSGGQDRDSTLLDHKPFWVLADHLSRAGIAVLRVDDRGVGGSTGHTPDDTTSDFADDALAGVRYLAERPEIDGRRVGIIGHSEGGLIAMIAASRSEQVAFVVSLAGTAVSGAELLPAQASAIAQAQGLPPMSAALQSSLMEARIETVLSAPDADAALDRLVAQAAEQLLASRGEGGELGEAERTSLRRQFAGFASPWMRYFLSTDPAQFLRQIEVPFLAINGTLDTQVLPEQNLAVFEEVLAQAGHDDVTIVRLEGLNHLLQTAESGAPGEYGAIEETLAPVLLETVTGWLRARFVEAGGSGEKG